MDSAPQSSPQTKPKLFCFVLMPFSSEFDDVYQIGIKEACQAAGAYCERVDEQHYNERMLERIYNQIAKADLIIADMTGKNANVFYEVGYAHALGKPTVLLTRNAADIPFDLTQYLHIVYESKLTVLREKLTSRVLWHINNPNAGLDDTNFPLKLLINGKNPSVEELALEVGPIHNDGVIMHGADSLQLEVTLGNTGNTSLSEGDFRLGLLTHIPHFRAGFTYIQELVHQAVLDNGATQFVFPTQSGLMPGEFQKIAINIVISNKVKLKDSQQVVFRLFTKTGYRDNVIFLRNPSR